MFKSLPRLTRAQAIPGDLLLFGTGAAADPPVTSACTWRRAHAQRHDGMWGLGRRMCETVVDWTRVVALARPLPGSPSYRQSVVAEPLDPYSGAE